MADQTAAWGGFGREGESSDHPHSNDGNREVADVLISSREAPPYPGTVNIGKAHGAL